MNDIDTQREPPRDSLQSHLTKLEAGLARLKGGKTAPMRLSQLDGFLAGVLVCPDEVSPDVWMPIAVGMRGADTATLVADPDRLEAMHLVASHFNLLAEALIAGGQRYAPIFDVDTQPGEWVWSSWMEGFKVAMAIRPESWMAIGIDLNDEDAFAAVAGMLALIAIATRTGDIPLDAEAQDLVDEAPDFIPEWVAELYRWRILNESEMRRRRRPRPAVSTKVGRNEPCPCGSGKKYKKCCGVASGREKAAFETEERLE